MIAIIGAGISGLIVANTLQKKNIPYILLETSNKTGGLIQTKKIGDYMIEVGPNTILIDDETQSILNYLNIQQPFIEALPTSKSRFIYKNKTVQPLPLSPIKFLFGNFLSFSSKITVLKEFFNRSVGEENENVYDFFVRHFNTEIADYVISPFILGIYAGDAKKLLIKDTFPQLKKYEIEYGSILKGFIKNKSKNKKSMGSYNLGLTSLTDTLSKQLQSLKINARVTSIEKVSDKWLLTINNEQKLSFDKIIFTTPSYDVASLIEPYWKDISNAFNNINYASMTAVYTAFKKINNFTPNGFGILFPPIENNFIAGTIFNSASFSNRAPEAEFMLTHFIGGIHHPEYVKMTDSETIDQVLKSISQSIKITDKPTFTYIHRWLKGIPQYDLNRNIAVKYLPTLENHGIYCTSNWTNGISLPDCIKNAYKLANSL
jgi:oxygen-dependent protoporphyrinogen oxidase